MPRDFGLTNVAPYAAAPAVGVAGATYWNTTSKILYVSDGSVWVAAGPGAGGPPTGAAGGDLSGSYPNPVVAKASGNFPYKAMAGSIYGPGTQTVPSNSTWTLVTQTTLGNDSSGGVIPVAAGSYLVVPYTGWVVACAFVQINAQGGTGVWVSIDADNGTGGASWGSIGQVHDNVSSALFVNTMRALVGGWRLRSTLFNQCGATVTLTACNFGLAMLGTL